MPESKKRPHPLEISRITVQLLLLALFLGLLLWTVRGTEVSAHPWIARLFLISDPLILVGAALAGAFTTALLAALAVVGLSLLAPRAYCGWICPLGTLQDVADKLLFRRRDRSANPAPRLRQVKYGLLAVVLVLAVFGLGVYGWFDPISIMTRSFGTALVPIAQDAGKTALVAAEKAETPGAAGAYDWARAHRLISDDANFKEGGRWAATRWGWTFVALLLAVLLVQAYQKRFWCRNLCPLGALLGLLGSASPLRPRVSSACVRCNKCREQCKMGAFEPGEEGTEYRGIVQECILCYACERSMCPVGAIHIGVGRPAPVRPAAGVCPSRRAFLGSAAVGAVLGPAFLLDRRSREKEESNPMLRPPGALKPDGDFQAACVRCGACMRVCPTNALHPSGIENGIAGIWTPAFVFNIGYCDYTCNVQAGEAGENRPANLCATVCPTGAIAPLARAEKNEWRIGTAVFDHNRCLPWARGEECLTCEEMCPVTPRAISHRTVEVANNEWLKMPDDRRNRYEQLEAKREEEGLTPAEEEELWAMPPKMRLLALPYLLPCRCTGCGVCENVCPVDGASGIRVERLQ
ncbi:MAG: 4Fe-4S binding protein, partial [Phycisphaerae bacterium]